MGPITSRWRIEPGECLVGFSVRSFGFLTVHGRFERVRGGFGACDDGSLADIWAEIDAESLTTGLGRRDRHLRSSDFLHVRRHPKIRFAGAASPPDAGGRRVVDGKLEIRGVERAAWFVAAVADSGRGSSPAALELTGSLDRREFGVTHFVDRLRFVIGARVDIDMTIRAAPAVAPVTRRVGAARPG